MLSPHSVTLHLLMSPTTDLYIEVCGPTLRHSVTQYLLMSPPKVMAPARAAKKMKNAAERTAPFRPSLKSERYHGYLGPGIQELRVL